MFAGIRTLQRVRHEVVTNVTSRGMSPDMFIPMHDHECPTVAGSNVI